MCSHKIISIFINLLMYSNVYSVYLVEQANYYKPRLERNNILNKGLWMKDKIEKSNYGDFIFRADSGDVDDLLQNNFDAFGQNDMDAIPVFSSYVERNKRSTINKQIQRLRKNINKCKDKTKCSKQDEDKPILYKSKFISQLRPTSVFNDYPYEVAVLLANSNKREANENKNLSKNLMETISERNKTQPSEFKLLNKNETTHNKTIASIPKRRMAQSEPAYEEKIFLETNNNTKYIDGNKIHRNVFDKEEKIWQSAPVQNMVLPRPESSVKNKPVTEKGLVKILSLLTKTFRKVMKQHNEIQEIDNKLHSLNEDFMKNVAVLDTKFLEFDTKYTHLLQVHEEIERLNEKCTKKNDEIQNKETDLTKNLKEFENQQKKFLSQQHQFYTIQKFILEQNEKINRKQSSIAKTQSEISHRQNNFARVLKKAKQFYMDKKFLSDSKVKNSSTIKEVDDENNITLTTTTKPIPTDSVKINLFSIPNVGPILNHDKLILEEKNDHPVDDLIYKYYFNNTFIDNLMKSKVLTAVIDNEAKNTRNTKNKRNNLDNETTILLPIGNTNEFTNNQNLHRERRWITHPNKALRKFHSKFIDNEKSHKNVSKIKNNDHKKDKNDPFLAMATNFCNEVGQNLNEQMLNWCVEKSLRRLKSIVKPLATPPLENIPEKNKSVGSGQEDTLPKAPKLLPHQKSIQTAETESMFTTNLPTILTPVKVATSTENAILTEKTPDVFFPDNDELESNLKQYELKSDPEGTVYFDGSLHTSDLVISGSDALSDVMPGLDSNSRVEVDPLTLDLQARRRAYVRRYNENILKKMHS